MLDTFVCLWSDVPQIISRGFLQSLARLCATAFQPESGSYSFVPCSMMASLVFEVK